MDAHQFDALTQVLSTGDSRRRLLAFLTALPVVGGVPGILTPEETEAAGRRKRRKKAHKHGKGRHRMKKCKAESVAQTCAGTCGSVTNNCKKRVDCGRCTCTPPCGTCERCHDTTCVACPACCSDVCCDQAGSLCHASTDACCVPDPTAQTCDGQCGDVLNNCGVVVDCGPCTCDPACPDCQICDTKTGACVADPTRQGQACGVAGKVCQGGTCVCSPGASCGDICCRGDRQCAQGACQPLTCPAGSTLCDTFGDLDYLSCCGAGSYCGGAGPRQSSCCPLQGGTCRSCPTNQVVCCTTDIPFSRNVCTCCTAGQTCTNGVCSG